MAPLEVIGAGFGRTGTDSLRTALNMLGYNTHHMKSFFEEGALRTPDDFYQAYLNKESADYDKLYEGFNAAVDWPTVSFYKELFAKYPNAKVILTERSADSWYKSVQNTILKVASHASKMQPGDKMYAHGRMVNTLVLEGYLADAEKFNANEEKIKQMFLDHNAEVKRHIPSDQLYVMQLGEGWEGMCKFLGKDVPSEPYPSTNSTEAFNKHISEAEFLKKKDATA